MMSNDTSNIIHLVHYCKMQKLLQKVCKKTEQNKIITFASTKPQIINMYRTEFFI